MTSGERPVRRLQSMAMPWPTPDRRIPHADRTNLLTLIVFVVVPVAVSTQGGPGRVVARAEAAALAAFFVCVRETFTVTSVSLLRRPTAAGGEPARYNGSSDLMGK